MRCSVLSEWGKGSGWGRRFAFALAFALLTAGVPSQPLLWGYDAAGEPCCGGKGFAPPRVAMGVGTQSRTSADKPRYVAGQLLVRFKDDVPLERIEALLDAHALSLSKPVGGPRVLLVKILDGTSVEEKVRRLRALAEVAEAGPNYITTRRPADPEPALQPDTGGAGRGS